MIKVVYIISDIDKALAFEWIAEHLDRNRFELSFLILNPGPSTLEMFLRERNIPVQTILFKGKKDWPSALFKTYQYLSKEKPHIVHCHLIKANIIGLVAAKLGGIKKRFYTRHHSDYHQRYFPKGIKWDKWCNCMATHIITPSGVVKNVLIEYEKVPEQKITVIHHGFDLNYFKYVSADVVHELKEKYNPREAWPVIGVISRFTELKGIQFIIPAFKKLLVHYPDALLLLFNANGDYKKQLNKQLAELPSKNCLAVPFEKELAAVYQLLDVFVQVSIDRTIEAFGQTYVEALAAGVPSIFTLSGIANDFIIDKENALVVPFKNSDVIYDAMKKLITDSALRERLIQNGKKSVQEKFDLRKMIRALENLYE